MKPYTHEPFTNFADETNKEAFQQALSYVQSQLGKEYPVVIGGESLQLIKKFNLLIQQIKKKSSEVFRWQTKNLQKKQCKLQ